MTSHAGYSERARYYAAEISLVPQPALLAGLLRPGLEVAEMPSGTGHFLLAYSAARADVTLVDACPQMLAVAQAQAARREASVTTVCGMIEDLPGQAGPFDLVVMPNGALNQLAAAGPPATLLTAVARLLAPGGRILAQVLVPGAACGFYDPGLADGTWHRDRQFTSEDGRLVTRRRRQHHHGGGVAIDFEMSRDGQTVHRQQVALRLLAGKDMQAALAEAGLRAVDASSGFSSLAEILCAPQCRGQR
jgi:SAM-dependent methyltransferase